MNTPQWRSGLAATFGFPGVAEAYRHRPPYPAEVFDLLERLITDRPRDVLDLGAGEGALARPLAARVDHVDAVDISAAMIQAGRGQPGGGRPNLRWIEGAVESAVLGGPYALVTAGASLHWMNPEPTMSRLAGVLADHAFLAVVDHGPDHVPWQEELTAVIARHSRSPGFDPGSSVVGALRESGLFELAGREECPPMPFRQSLADYVEQFHSTSSLARELMPASEAAAFDRAVGEIAAPWAAGGVLELTVVASVTWGRPLASPVS